MKTTNLHSRSQAQAGNVLVLTIIFGAVVGVVLLSYLELIQGRTKVRARSMAWNQAIPVLESGIEEALTHIQDDSTNLTANGWSQAGSGSTATYSRTQTNSDSTYYIVTISNANSFPLTTATIYSQGFVPAPLDSGYISRLVQVVTTNSMLYSKAISAKGKVDLNGQSQVDAFDSSNTNYSTGGRYDPAKRKDGASVVSNSRSSSAIDVGNGHIYGSVSTGAGGTVDYNGGGTVGDLAWSATHSGIESGYSSDDLNINFVDVSAPPGYNSWAPLAKATAGNQKVGTTNYTYVVTGQITAYGGLSMNSHDTMAIVGNTTLFVAGDLSVNGNAMIYLAPGATLKLYVSGGNTTINGGGILNGSGTASSLSYLGLPNNTTVKYTGQADFVGTINAPEADVTISGGANLYGAAIVNTYTSKSSGSGLHYDQGVGTPGILKVVSYREL